MSFSVRLNHRAMQCSAWRGAIVGKGQRCRRSDLRLKTEKPPVGCRGRVAVVIARRRDSIHPRSFIVAWIDIVRHTSVYKRNPLFDRRVPAPITSTLKGLLIALIERRSGDPSKWVFSKTVMRSNCSSDEPFLHVADQMIGLNAHTVSEGDRCLGKVAQ